MTLTDLRNALKTEKIVIGKDRTLKALRNKKVKKIFLAKNCQDTLREDVKHYAKISKVDVEELNLSNEELGAVCKKPFSVSILCY